MSQNEQILNHLAAGRPLTSLDALGLFGCLRLGARIFNLRAAGHDVTSKMIKTDTGKMIAEYRL